jgi:hypothetical protein
MISGVSVAARAAVALGVLLLAAFPSSAIAQQRTPTGFYYPVATTWPASCGGFLDRDLAHGGCYTNGLYHLGEDLVAALDAPVYALASGTVIAKADVGWGGGNVAVLIQHTLIDGTKFIGLYGHVRSALNIGDTVVAGAPIANIGPMTAPALPHVHLGIIPGTTIPAANLGAIANSYWPSSNGFVDPVPWITTRTPAASPTARLTVTVTGSGVVGSVQAGIACGGGYTACAVDFLRGTNLSLLVAPSQGWSFAGWSGACSGTSGCALALTDARTVNATFVPSTYVLGSFGKTGPFNPGTRQSTVATLSWREAAGAGSYEYCVDTVNNAMCDTAWVNVGRQTFAAPPTLTAGATYYWQARARNGSTISDADSGLWWKFTTQRTAAQFVCDVNYDGRADLIWQRTTDGLVAAWFMAGATATGSAVFQADPQFGAVWQVAGLGDFNGDTACDLLFRNQTDGRLTAWMMDGTRRWAVLPLTPSAVPDMKMKIRSVTDLNGDGFSDVIWQNEATGQVSAWLMNGTSRADVVPFSPQQEADLSWKVVGAADMNADGRADLIWQHQQQGWLNVWLMSGSLRVQSLPLTPSQVSDVTWKIQAVGDMNWDGEPELIWQNSTAGYLASWMARNLVVYDSTLLTPAANPDKTWRLAGPK